MATAADSTADPSTGNAAGAAAGRSMTVRGAAFLGVGSMVGAGIFALLGEAGAVAGSAVWLSFLLAGAVAALQGYAVAKLGARYPSSGGIVTFLIKGFGPGHVTAVTSWLLYFAAVIVTAMVAVSFGSYGSALFFGDDSTDLGTVLLTVRRRAAGRRGEHRRRRSSSTGCRSLIVHRAARRLRRVHRGHPRAGRARACWPPRPTRRRHGHRLERRADVLRLPGLHRRQLHRRATCPTRGATCPGRCTSRSGITTVLYVLVIAIGVFGTLTVRGGHRQRRHRAGRGGQARRSGEAGFAMMAVAALLATSSSVNANIYAATGSTAKLAETGTFPPVFGQARPGRWHPGAGHLGGRWCCCWPTWWT